MKAIPCMLAVWALLAFLPGTSNAAYFSIYQYGTSNSSAIVDLTQDSVLDLEVRMSAGPGEPVLGVRYDVVDPVAVWSLLSRDAASFGWGAFEGSVPDPTTGTFPALVDNALYPVTPAIPDFYTDTSRGDFVSVTGDYTIERFRLSIPRGMPTGIAHISLANAGAYDDEYNEYGDIATNGFDVDLRVIPEPGSSLLFAVGLLGMLARKRQRPRSAQD